MKKLAKMTALTVFCLLCVSGARAQTVTYPLSRVLVDLRGYPFDSVIEEAARQASGETSLAYSSTQKEFSIVFGSGTGEDDVEVGDAPLSFSLLFDDGVTLIICEVLSDGSTVVVYEQHRYCLPQHLPAFETGERKSFYVVPFALEPHKRYRIKLVYANPWFYGYRDRDGGSAFLGSEAKDTKVTIGTVERAGTLADGKPLPNSIAPGKVSSDIAVTINQLDPGEKVQFVVVDSGLNPSQKAEIESTNEGGDTLTQNGTIKIKGVAQTDPGARTKLKIAARIVKNGQPPGRFLWVSADFTVCAHPVNFVLNGIYNNNDALKYGMAVIHKWDSDAANADPALLHRSSVKEIVSTKGQPDNPPWLRNGSDTSGWLSGNGKAAGLNYVSLYDTHSTPPGDLQNPPTAKGKIVKDQYQIFACDRCGIAKNDNAPKIPNSDFVITRDCDKNQKNEYVVQTIKDGPGAPLGGLKSAVEAGQPPQPPTGMTIVMAIQNGNQTFTITWTDNSDIEEGFRRWRWSKTANDWVRRDPDFPPNIQQDTVSFSGQPFQRGDVFKYRVRIYNWRKSINDASQDLEASFTVP